MTVLSSRIVEPGEAHLFEGLAVQRENGVDTVVEIEKPGKEEGRKGSPELPAERQVKTESSETTADSSDKLSD